MTGESKYQLLRAILKLGLMNAIQYCFFIMYGVVVEEELISPQIMFYP